MTQLEPPVSPTARSPLQAVADAVARHYKEQFGRGPQRCRAHFAGRDAILVVLDGTMSPAERRLTDLGEGERVRGARSALQRAVQGDLVAAVQEVAGRPVQHAVSGIDVEHDVATELFTLDPPAGSADGPLSASAPAG
ncbi:Na-translocating system protein MpsC family protein [Patulibacter sp. NPDC049589]|uniref:Na-translocating system protein MpsC family protein n=1 Tax=Patulibacter sp. NPDC049589 TaxID=3154731 RepID=UPI0034257C06